MNIVLLCSLSALMGAVGGFGIHFYIARRFGGVVTNAGTAIRGMADHVPGYRVAYRQSLKNVINWLDNVPGKAEVAIRRDAENLSKELKAKL